MTSPLPYWCPKTIESLSHGDGDGNRNSKNAIGLDWQNNNIILHMGHAFCTFLCCQDCDGKMPNIISLFVEDVNTRERLSFPFPELRYSLLEFNSRKICQH